MSDSQSNNACSVENFSGEMVGYDCGHSHPRNFNFNLFGETVAFADVASLGHEKCAQCLLDQLLPGLIRCCLCGFYIAPGEPITLYSDVESINTEWKKVVDEDRFKGAIGCLRVNCCETGGGYCGNWDGTKCYVPDHNQGSSTSTAG